MLADVIETVLGAAPICTLSFGEQPGRQDPPDRLVKRTDLDTLSRIILDKWKMSTSCCDIEGSRPELLRLKAVSTTVCLVATAGGWALPGLGYGVLATPLLGAAYVAGGWHPLREAYRAMRCGKLDVDLLMLVAAVGAALVGHWLEGAVLLFLFSLGNTLETYAFRRTRRSIQALVERRPEEAELVENSGARLVRLETLVPGQIVRVRPGERIPVDGDVVEGSSHVDESTLTGESMPVPKAVAASVFAGTLNGPGSLDVRVTRTADDTTLARIIRMVEDARESKAPTQSWIERVESRYAVGVLVAASAAILIPWLGLGWSFDDALYRAMALLVVASPCALVISIPATLVSAVANGARHGILFKGGAHLDALSEVTTFALDKTGTLTMGRPELVALRTRALTFAGGSSGLPWAGATAESGDAETTILRLAAAAESRSEHHLGSAIVRAAEERGIPIPDVVDFSSTPGHGVEATVSSDRVLVGRRSWIEAHVGTPVEEALTSLFEGDHAEATPVYVAINGQHAAAIAIQDQPRPGITEALTTLKATGIRRTVMLTGDAEETARGVASRLGIDDVYADLRPDDKSRILEELRRAHGPVAMVGDGVNDAPALATADVGIALGVAGTDVALETADIVVMGDDLASLAEAVRLSHRTRRIVLQNLVFAVSVMVCLVIAALMGWIGLTEAVIGHEGSTIVVVFNGLRLLSNGR